MDERTRYFRRLRQLRRAARRWSVLAGGFGGAAAVLTPYHGLGLPDAGWAAAAGASVVLAFWRWRDLRELAGRPAPPPPDPALMARRNRQKLEAMVVKLPAGQAVVDEVRRAQGRMRLRGTAAADAWVRLDRAASALTDLAGRLTGPAEGALREATVAEGALREATVAEVALREATAAEGALRDLAERTASVERGIRLAPPDARVGLEHSHRELVAQLDDGVAAYERLVAAAAGYLAEESRPTAEHQSVARLTEAADLLRGVAAGFSELRTGCPGRWGSWPVGDGAPWSAGDAQHVTGRDGQHDRGA